MKNFPQLSHAQNRLLQDSFEQLPQEIGFHFQASLNKLLEALESLAINGEIDLEQLDTTRDEYPSIITDEIYQSLLQHFEE